MQASNRFINYRIQKGVAWRVINTSQLRSLLDNTIDETLAQKLTIIYGVADLLEQRDVKISNKHKKYLGLLKQSAIEASNHMRAIQKALRLQEKSSPVPIRKHGINNIIILDYLTSRN